MNETQNNSTLPLQNKQPAQSKGLLTPILLITLPTPLWVLSMLATNSEAIASLSSRPVSWLTILVYITCLLLLVADFLLPLAIPPCIAIGVGQLIKRRRLLAKNLQPDPAIDTSSPSFAAGRKKKAPWLTLIMIILWIVVPIGFFFAWFAEGYGYGLNSCAQDSSPSYCQPSYLGVYFIIYLIVASTITVYSIIKE